MASMLERTICSGYASRGNYLEALGITGGEEISFGLPSIKSNRAHYPSPEEEVTRQEEAKIIREFIEDPRVGLTEEQRKTLQELSEGQSIKEIAEKRGISTTAVYGRLKRIETRICFAWPRYKAQAF